MTRVVALLADAGRITISNAAALPRSVAALFCFCLLALRDRSRDGLTPFRKGAQWSIAFLAPSDSEAPLQ
ncbi:MAG: hypothetical protein AAF596_04325, partial [Planctomycetota bacterium]